MSTDFILLRAQSYTPPYSSSRYNNYLRMKVYHIKQLSIGDTNYHRYHRYHKYPKYPKYLKYPKYPKYSKYSKYSKYLNKLIHFSEINN